MLRRVLFFLAMVFCPLAAMAAAAPYEVRQVAVEVPVAEDGSSTPTMSRQQGLEMAADQGLRQLLKLITPQDSWPKQDELLKKNPAKNLLERFNIVQETSRLPYRLVVDLYFKRDALRKLLADNGIPYVDTRQESVLVVPVYIVGENAQMFEQENPWGSAVQVALEGPHLARFQLPAGDYDDMMTLTPQMAILGVTETIQALGQKHKADMVLVSVAKVSYRDGKRVLQVQSNWYGEAQRTPVNFEANLPDGDATAAMQQAAKQLVQGVENQWRSSRSVEVNKPQSLVAFLNVTHVAGLEKTLKDLNGIASVQQAFLRSLTKREAYIQIDYYGESADLAENLSRHNLVLTNQEGRWLLNHGQSLPGFSGQTEAPQAVSAPVQGSSTEAVDGTVEE